MKNRKQKQDGFTLVELMIVVGIICILASIAIPVYARYRENAWRAKCVTNLRTIHEARLAWSVENPDAAQLTDLGGLAADGYFRGKQEATEIPKCPATDGTYTFEQDRTKLAIPPTCAYYVEGNGHSLLEY